VLRTLEGPPFASRCDTLRSDPLTFLGTLQKARPEKYIVSGHCPRLERNNRFILGSYSPCFFA
jgi:hypothetical protein